MHYGSNFSESSEEKEICGGNICYRREYLQGHEEYAVGRDVEGKGHVDDIPMVVSSTLKTR